MDLKTRAKEISDYLNIPFEEAYWRLDQGFIYNHHKVTEDFNNFAPVGDDGLLDWYRQTEAYIWELSAYHLDAGYNYMGMAGGCATHLKNEGKERVLVLGDGVGDLTQTLYDAGLKPIYHDLDASRTAGFAMSHLQTSVFTTEDWDIKPLHVVFAPDPPDAVVAWDFFEHLVNVEEWVQAIFDVLKPGGIMQAQNAFAIGDDEHGGSMPMHLVRNNKYEKEWDPMLERIGFVDLKNGWRQKPSE